MIEFNQLVSVGKTSWRLPRYGLGTGPMGKIDEATAVSVAQAALAQGITFFDTAPLYGQGQAEVCLGRALAGVPRQNYIVATKVGRLLRHGEAVFDFSREAVLRSLEESLARLKLDYVDILHIHDPDHHYGIALDEAFPALAELRRQGVIKAIGAGMNQWQMLRDFALNADFDCFLLAGRYTLLEQTSLELLSVCHEKNISLILGGVYNSGILASDLQPGAKYNYQAASPEILERARQINAICTQHNVPLNVAAIQFPYRHPAVTSIVMGADTPAQISANLAALRVEIPAQLWSELGE